jgi:hypothetical protein
MNSAAIIIIISLLYSSSSPPMLSLFSLQLQQSPQLSSIIHIPPWSNVSAVALSCGTIRAEATALCNGNNDCTHANSPGNLKKTEAGRLVSKRDLKEREGDETEDVRREELLATTARCAAVVAAVSGTPLFLQILNTCLVVEDQDFAILAAMITAFSPSHAPLKNPFLRQKCTANLSSCCFSSLSQTFGTASHFRVRA